MLNRKSFIQHFLLTLSVTILMSLLFSSTAFSQEKHCSEDCQKKEFKYVPKIFFGNMANFGSFGYTDVAKSSGLAGTSLPAASITGTETQTVGFGWFKKPILLQILDLDNENSIKAEKELNCSTSFKHLFNWTTLSNMAKPCKPQIIAIL